MVQPGTAAKLILYCDFCRSISVRLLTFTQNPYASIYCFKIYFVSRQYTHHVLSWIASIQGSCFPFSLNVVLVHLHSSHSVSWHARAWSCSQICLCDFEVGDTVRQLPCLHELHQPCIDRYVVMKTFQWNNVKQSIARNCISRTSNLVVFPNLPFTLC